MKRLLCVCIFAVLLCRVAGDDAPLGLDGIFSGDECRSIITTVAVSQEAVDGVVDGTRNVPEFKRNSVRNALLPNLAWAITRLSTQVQRAAARWHLPPVADYPNGGLELVEYHAPGGHYDWHADDHAISMTVQLSPATAYQGGGVQLWHSGQLVSMGQEQGTTVLFPSYTIHRVLPVSNGTRVALVGWWRLRDGENWRHSPALSTLALNNGALHFPVVLREGHLQRLLMHQRGSALNVLGRWREGLAQLRTTTAPGQVPAAAPSPCIAVGS